jgi:hypothetical protein
MTTEQTATITDEEKAAAAKQDAETRRLVNIQLDTQDERRRKEQDNNLGAMTQAEFLRYTKERYGF